ncbi:hypothetical protein ACI3TF_29240, partial [Klebsiella pneumoniae]
GYDPQNPTESTREMDFNALVDLLINTGYTPAIADFCVSAMASITKTMSPYTATTGDKAQKIIQQLIS